MGRAFAEIAFTPAVKELQSAAGSRRAYEHVEKNLDRRSSLGRHEASFITERDGFYMATVSANDWPYLQFRGGPAGFVHVLDDRTLAFANLRGNRQYLTVGNLAGNDRVLLFFMDYANQERLKVWGHARVSDDPELLARLTPAGERGESAIVIQVEAFDWNCNQHITPRYTAEEYRRMYEAV